MKVEKYQVAQGVCAAMVLIGIAGIAMAALVPSVEAHGYLTVSTLAHGVQAGGALIVGGETHQQFPDGTFHTITLPAGTYEATLCHGNANQNETTVVSIVESGNTVITFVGNVAATEVPSVPSIEAPFVPTPTPTPTTTPEVKETPTPKDEEKGVGNENAASHSGKPVKRNK